MCDPVLVFSCLHVICTGCFSDFCASRLNERRFELDDELGYTLGCPIGCEDSLISETRQVGNAIFVRYNDRAFVCSFAALFTKEVFSGISSWQGPSSTSGTRGSPPRSSCCGPVGFSVRSQAAEWESCQSSPLRLKQGPLQMATEGLPAPGHRDVAMSFVGTAYRSVYEYLATPHSPYPSSD